MHGENKCIINLSTVRDLCSLSLSVHKETDWQEQQMYAELPSMRSGWWITKRSGWWDARFEPGLPSSEGICCRNVTVRSILVLGTVSFRRLQALFFFFKPVGLRTASSRHSELHFLEDFGGRPVWSVWVQRLQGGEWERVGCKPQHLVGMPRVMWPEEAQAKGTSHPSLSSLVCAEQPSAPAHPPAVFLLGLRSLSAPDQMVWLCATAYV